MTPYEQLGFAMPSAAGIGQVVEAMPAGVLKTDDIHPPKTGISVHFSCSLL